MSADMIIPNQVELVEADILNPAITIDQKLDLASDIATKFKSAIQKLGLIQNIKGNEYVTVSGWSTLGTLIGIHVENIRVEPFPVQRGFAYHAKVDLVNKDGIKIGEGDGIATNQGFQKDPHTVYSMAQTRAVGKAYRLSLAWLVEMAGYNPTPYEEMPDEMLHNVQEDNVDVSASDDEVVSILREIRDELVLLDKPVTKSSMRSCVVKKINNGSIDSKLRPSLIQYINNHCPEESI